MNPSRQNVTTTVGNSTCSANISPSERRVHSLVRPAPRAFFHPDRQISQPSRAGPVKAGRVFAATRRAWPRQVTRKFIPLALREIHAVGNTQRCNANQTRHTPSRLTTPLIDIFENG